MLPEITPGGSFPGSSSPMGTPSSPSSSSSTPLPAVTEPSSPNNPTAIIRQLMGEQGATSLEISPVTGRDGRLVIENSDGYCKGKIKINVTPRGGKPETREVDFFTRTPYPRMAQERETFGRHVQTLAEAYCHFHMCANDPQKAGVQNEFSGRVDDIIKKGALHVEIPKGRDLKNIKIEWISPGKGKNITLNWSPINKTSKLRELIKDPQGDLRIYEGTPKFISSSRRESLHQKSDVRLQDFQSEDGVATDKANEFIQQVRESVEHEHTTFVAARDRVLQEGGFLKRKVLGETWVVKDAASAKESQHLRQQISDLQVRIQTGDKLQPQLEALQTQLRDSEVEIAHEEMQVSLFAQQQKLYQLLSLRDSSPRDAPIRTDIQREIDAVTGLIKENQEALTIFQKAIGFKGDDPMIQQLEQARARFQKTHELADQCVESWEDGRSSDWQPIAEKLYEQRKAFFRYMSIAQMTGVDPKRLNMIREKLSAFYSTQTNLGRQTDFATLMLDLEAATPESAASPVAPPAASSPPAADTGPSSGPATFPSTPSPAASVVGTAETLVSPRPPSSLPPPLPTPPSTPPPSTGVSSPTIPSPTAAPMASSASSSQSTISSPPPLVSTRQAESRPKLTEPSQAPLPSPSTPPPRRLRMRKRRSSSEGFDTLPRRQPRNADEIQRELASEGIGGDEAYAELGHLLPEAERLYQEWLGAWTTRSSDLTQVNQAFQRYEKQVDELVKALKAIPRPNRQASPELREQYSQVKEAVRQHQGNLDDAITNMQSAASGSTYIQPRGPSALGKNAPPEESPPLLKPTLPRQPPAPPPPP